MILDINENEQVAVINLGNARIYQSSSKRFKSLVGMLAYDLLQTVPFNAGKWQALDISGSDAHATHELLNVTVRVNIPDSITLIQLDIGPDLPWAESHFRERVGGKPINPGEAEAYWPYHANQGDLHKRDQLNKRYDHNYMERMWCTGLEVEGCDHRGDHFHCFNSDFRGYRFNVGDLGSVVEQLKRDRHTRQAYLPIWFPEDTGATAGQRVPCSLGYHFIIRDNVLHVQYNLRSVEVYRHFRNDVYMAMRLGQWMADKIHVGVGDLTMHMVSFHGFVGDTPHIQAMAEWRQL